MLTITRKENEALIITAPDGEEIRIVVHKFHTDQIKVSIEASSDYVINREELLGKSIT